MRAITHKTDAAGSASRSHRIFSNNNSLSNKRTDPVFEGKQVIQMFPKRYAVLLIACVACAFAGSHVAAKVAFNEGLGLLLALACRSGFTAAILLLIALLHVDTLRIERRLGGWLLLTGALVAVQGVLIYAAVSIIPVGLALLVVNLSPVFLCLITWLLGGAAPSRSALSIMALILAGLSLALDVPHLLAAQARTQTNWLIGIACGLAAAVLYASALWVTSNKLHHVPGSVRSLMTVAMVLVAALAAGGSGVIPGGLSTPASGQGWAALAVLVSLYGLAFSVFFVLMPKLDLARNGPAMNIEPVAGLMLGWLVLEQAIGDLQLLGAAVVLTGVGLLTLARQRE
ncbi:EamA family transporter [Pseudomonas putida]|uniref:EamA family transporter n=1 Tax=Pseudomonas putida TaxID=303 RepID=UPI003F3560CB